MGWLRNIVNEARGAVTNVIRDPMGAIDPRTALPHLGTTLVRGAGLALGMDPDKAMGRLGFTVKGPSLNEQLQELGAREASQEYLDAIADRNIDDISKNEIFDIWRSGGNATELGKKIAAAREGKGIYGVRKVNQAQGKQAADMPGRRQLLAVNRTMGK